MNKDKIKFLNTYVNNVNMNECVEYIEKFIQNKKKSYIVPVNVDIIVKMENDNYLKKIIDEADLTVIDGTPLMWISKILKNPFKEKISGSDLVPLICKIAWKKKYTLFIIGGKEGIAEKAKKNLELQYNGIKIIGTYSPPLGFEKNNSELEKINNMISKVKPDILITCFGCPKQEKFIYENIEKYDAKVSICAGATVDFLAGNVKRAPKWISSIGFEWFYRFTKEPKRLFKRYFIDDMKIFNIYFKYK